jgi:predicted RNA binding protein YcfA (HicA-like mRNA interferase family)
MKVREVIKLIEEDGWYLARTRGSHQASTTEFDKLRATEEFG